jgi:hypothetical protein
MGQSSGIQLASAVSNIFRRMLPSAPPRRGLRLDTRWGEFGILAARYFGPYLYGSPYPSSLRESWRGIDSAILLFLYNGNGEVSEEERSQYYLVANEPEIAANSTISDWHRKGIEALAELVMQEEQRLGGQVPSQSSEIQVPISSARLNQPRFRAQRIWRWIGRISLVLLILFFALAGWKGWQIYEILRSVQVHAEALLSLSTLRPGPELVEEAGEHLASLRLDLQFQFTVVTCRKPPSCWRWVSN